MGEPLATTDDVAGRLPRALTSAEGEQLPALLLDVSSAIRSYTHQTFTEEETTALLPIRSGAVRLMQLPVTAVSSVTDGRGNDLSYEWLNGDERISLCSGGYLNEFELNILPGTRVGKASVTYTHGYAEIPDLIVGLACHLALRALGVPSMQAGIMQESITNYSYQIGTAAASGPFGLSAAEKELLDSYRRLPGPVVMI